METFGNTIKKLRQKKELPLRIVAAYLDIDQAILSKIERGQRDAARTLVIKLAKYYKVKENELVVAWLSDKLVNELSNELLALKALQVAEEKIEYATFKKTDRKDILKKLKIVISGFKQVKKAWIYGSFARENDGPKSDVDIALQTDSSFSYFDLAEVKHVLENTIRRKVDVGFIDSFKSYIFEHVRPDLKLIYER